MITSWSHIEVFDCPFIPSDKEIQAGAGAHNFSLIHRTADISAASVSIANPEPTVLCKFEVLGFRQREGGPIPGEAVDADKRPVDRDDVEGIVLAAAARRSRCSGLDHQR